MTTNKPARAESANAAAAGMTLKLISIPYSHFKGLREDEQVFLVHMMRLLNEINMLRQWLLVVNNVEVDHPVERTAQRMQGMFIMTTTAGKLYEGWEALRHSYLNSPLSKDYESKLDAEAKAALQKLKDYFNRKNALNALRNTCAFHYDNGTIKSAIAEACLRDNDLLRVIVTPNMGTCLFEFAEDFGTKAVLNCFAADDDLTCDATALEGSAGYCGCFSGLRWRGCLEALSECRI